MRDILADIFNEVCHDVEIEPHLEPITGEILPENSNITENGRLEIAIGSIWQ